MRNVFWIAIAAVFFCADVSASEEAFYCAHTITTEVAAAEESASDTKRWFAPSRLVDVHHLKLDVTPDFRERTVAGTATLTFSPIALPVRSVRLDHQNLNVHAVTSSHPISEYDVTDEAIVVTYKADLSPSDTVLVAITYDAEPKKGLYFRTRELGFPIGDEHIWTQGETHESRHWYPSVDYPNERFTSEIICRVPSDMIVLSNGTELSTTVDDKSGLRSSRWMQSEAHPSYLVALVAGRFKKVSSKYKDIPLGLYVQPSEIDQAMNTFDGMEDMMSFFEEEIGVPYPWDQYNQVTILDFYWGGMENTGLVTLSSGTLHRKELTEEIRSSRGLVAHELAHQWFGDYVTCKDWSHIWLNEGFASYYESMHNGHVNGNDHFLYAMLRRVQNIAGNKSRKPMVQRDYSDPDKMFDFRAYSKGSWILHMLRSQLGDDLYRNCIRTYLERHALGSVVTEDLNRIIEELSGRSFDAFFDQWVYHARQPELKVSYSWDAEQMLAKVSVQQTQKRDADVLLFSFPTKIRFRGEGWSVDHAIVVSEASHDFYLKLDEKPTTVRFDPDLTVLAKVDFKKPRSMLYELMADSTDVLSRLIATKALGSEKDKKTIGKLKEALNGDQFYGVRRRASEALAKIGTPEALLALTASADQSNARVREQVVRDIGKFYHPVARRASKQIIETESNPTILRWAYRSLAKYHGEDGRQAISEGLKSTSYRDYQAYYAQEAIQVIDDPSLTSDLVKFVSRRDRKVPGTWFGNTLETIGRLNRNEKKKDGIRDLLVGYANDPNERIQRGAIRALGFLEDTRAISIVASFTGGGADKNSVQKAADGTLKKLRGLKKVSIELKDLTSEVMKLKEQNESLEEDVKDLKKQFEAKEKVDAVPEKSDSQESDD
jgi:aminopeptidase N